MAYCDKCGAYIPGGQTKCLACGYDPEEEKRAAEAKAQAEAQAKAQAQAQAEAQSAASQSAQGDVPVYGSRIDGEQLRQQLENQRRKQQEYSRKWAEAEHERREKERREQERARAWAEAERERQRQEREQRAREQRARGQYRSADFASGSTAQDFPYSRLIAMGSYLGVLCVIPFLFCEQDDFAMYHAKQGVTLTLLYWALRLVLSVFGFGIGKWILRLLRILLALRGIMTARNGIRSPLPYIGDVIFKR